MRLLQRPELTGCLSHEESTSKLGCITFEDLRCKLSVALVRNGDGSTRKLVRAAWPVISVKKGFYSGTLPKE